MIVKTDKQDFVLLKLLMVFMFVPYSEMWLVSQI